MGINTMRPGVFSEYTVSSLYPSRKSEKSAALLVNFTANEPVWLTSMEQARGILAVGDEVARNCLSILFGAGLSRVLCVPLPTDATAQQVEAALAAIANQDVYAVVADVQPQHFATLKAAVEAASTAQHERIAFCGVAEPTTALTSANELCSERMVLACPSAMPKNVSDTALARAVYTAAALAGEVLAMNDPSVNLSGKALDTLGGVGRGLINTEVEQLLGGGVTPFELVGGNVECIRAITTRTKTAGIADRSFAPIGTIMIIDDVMTTVRAMLKTRLTGLKNTPQSLSAIASQVTVILSEKMEQGIITAFEKPTATPLASDPSICVVEMVFNVAYAVNQIHIKAHIMV